MRVAEQDVMRVGHVISEKNVLEYIIHQCIDDYGNRFKLKSTII